MYCPECRAEYREGFTACSDCGAPLVAKLPAEPEPGPPPDALLDPEPGPGPPTPYSELVTVFSTGDPIVLALAKGCLDEAHIPYFLTGEARGRTGMIDPWRGQWSEFVVAREREAEARALLEPLTTPEETSEDPAGDR